MSGMEVVKKRLPSLETTQRRYVSTNLEVLKHLETVLDRVKDGHKDGAARLTEGVQHALDESSKRLTNNFKEYHAVISKLSKDLDKVLEEKRDHFDARLPRSVDIDKDIRRLLLQYLCRKALPQAAHKLQVSAEASSSSSDEAFTPSISAGEIVFMCEMSEVMKSLRLKDIIPAERWVFSHRMQLGRLATARLTFDIVRIRYLMLFDEPYSESQLQKVLKFVEQRLSVFYAQYESEIRPLLPLLVSFGEPSSQNTTNAINAVPSTEFYMSQLENSILKHCSKINFLPGNGNCSNLEVLVNVGVQAAVIANTALQFVSLPEEEEREVKRQKNLFDLEASGIPVDFKIKQEQRYHSVFCCPVSRQPATNLDPPVLLQCGHAILMSSMKALPRRNNKLKCPTCYGQSDESKIVSLQI